MISRIISEPPHIQLILSPLTPPPPPILSLPRFILRIFQLSAKGAGRWFPVKQMTYTETTRGVHRVTLETRSGATQGIGL